MVEGTTEFPVEFLGNKTSLLPWITGAIRAEVPSGGRVADVFSGTAAVAAQMRAAGYSVHANDVLPLCVTWARARILAPSTPSFEGLRDEIGLGDGDALEAAISHLNGLPGEAGWVTQNYTPASKETSGHERMYLTETNGAKVDAIRREIHRLQPWLTEPEYSLLLTSLVAAVSAVSNVAGTYGAFLKTWKPRALQPIVLKPVRAGLGSGEQNLVTSTDAEIAGAETDADLVYADPPYTKRQYAAYYHLLNTLVQDQDPSLTGSTGLPNWRQWGSDWCYSRKAPRALENLVAKCAAPKFILSYSSDGHIPHPTIMDILNTYGRAQFLNSDYRRYKSSRLDHRSSTVTERIYVVSR
jgi:adenine-specific DNA-methyltransferase